MNSLLYFTVYRKGGEGIGTYQLDD